VECIAVSKESQETIGRRVANTLERLLVHETDTAVLTPSELMEAIQRVDAMGSQCEGPRIVVKAWTDRDFAARLIEDANKAVTEIGIGGSNSAYSTKLVAVENTDNVHNVVVCTLCSCYPLSILGLSPPWYKSRSYRARVVRQPRLVLREFGTDISAACSIRVHDSTADMRYIVIPRRPQGTEGWCEEKLMRLVTRDSMIGVRECTSPHLIE
jgi:nitrile hydratase subunit alpha